jgi:hypothetical protein
VNAPQPVQVFPGVVILTGQALKDLHFCVLAGIREASRTGYPTTRFEGIRRAIRDADTPLSAQRQDDVAAAADAPDSPNDDEALIDTGEAARLLGVSRRTAQRLARQELGRLVAGTWLLDRRLVIAEAAARRKERQHETTHRRFVSDYMAPEKRT